MGGTGFSPPYLNPKNPPAAFTEDVAVRIDHKVYKVQAKTAEKFLQSMGERWQKPAMVFCSRDLENGLGTFVKSEIAKGVVPTDEQLRAKAKEILGVQDTAADDMQLLGKFKSLHGIGGDIANLIDPSPASNSNNLTPNVDMSGGGPMPDYALPNFTDDVSMLAEFDMELGAMDLTTDFGTGTGAGLDIGMDLSGVDVGQQSSQADGVGSVGMRMGGGMGMNDEAMQDYAELYRVHAATASPLRRKASEKLAAKVGSSDSPRGNMYAG